MLLINLRRARRREPYAPLDKAPRPAYLELALALF